MGGRTDRQKDGWTDGRKDGRRGQTVGKINGRKEGRRESRTGVRTNGWISYLHISERKSLLCHPRPFDNMPVPINLVTNYELVFATDCMCL